MIKRKNILIIVAVLLQCFALAAICFQRETILDSGDIVYMRTAPVDPRDLFRGDYVWLNYEFSSLPISFFPEEMHDKMTTEMRVYLIYEIDDNNVLVPKKVSIKKPLTGIKYLRAYTTGPFVWNASLKFGIEKYFMEQGTGRILERGKSLKGIRIPLEMEVAIGKGDGIAVIKGYRYSKLAMNIKMPERSNRKENDASAITLQFINASDKPLAIVCPEDRSAFEIEILPRWNGRDPAKVKVIKNKKIIYSQSDIKLLKPEEAYQVKIDLNSPNYQLQKKGKQITWKEFFSDYQIARIKYVAPAPEMLKGLEGAENLWNGVLYSRIFSGNDLSN
ncbi:MAG: GDYXXLXY domain-containing protein [Pseudomonadota bacterium]